MYITLQDAILVILHPYSDNFPILSLKSKPVVPPTGFHFAFRMELNLRFRIHR